MVVDSKLIKSMDSNLLNELLFCSKNDLRLFSIENLVFLIPLSNFFELLENYFVDIFQKILAAISDSFSDYLLNSKCITENLLIFSLLKNIVIYI